MVGGMETHELRAYLATQVDGKIPEAQPFEGENGNVVHLSSETWGDFKEQVRAKVVVVRFDCLCGWEELTHSLLGQSFGAS